jgi:hypothetical protein
MTKHIETGVTQCGDDWPGVFIRGDHAAMYALHLKAVLDCLEWDDFRERTLVNSLIGLLEDSRVGNHKPEDIQHITLTTKDETE